MAIRNPQVTKRTANTLQKVENLKDEIGRTSDDLRRIVGEEYDSYTETQKKLAEEVFTQRNMFFNPDGTARAMVGSEPNRYAGKTFDDTLLGKVIREAAPLYKTLDTMGEGLVSREKEFEAKARLFDEATSPKTGMLLEQIIRPGDDEAFEGLAERDKGFYARQRDKIEDSLPSEVDDFSGYAQGIERMDRLDPESSSFRQGLAEGGEAENPAVNFFTSQRTYSPDEYASGYVNFYGGSLGTGVDVTTVDEDEDEDEDNKETIIQRDVLRPVGDDEDSIIPATKYTFGEKGRQSAFEVRSYSYGDGSSDFELNINNFAKAGTQDLSESFVKEYMKSIKGPGIQADVKQETAISPLSATVGPTLASAAGTFMGKQVEVPFGKETTLRPAGVAGFALDAALAFHTKNAAAVNLVGGKAGALMTVNNMLISRRPGKFVYTGNLGGLSQEQMRGIEATKEGFISGTLRDEYDEKTNTWKKTGMKGLLDADDAFRVGGNVSETGYFIGTFGGGAKLTGAAGLKNEQFAAAYKAVQQKYPGVTQSQFQAALLEAQQKAGFFGTVRTKHRNATFLTDALTRIKQENDDAYEAAADASLRIETAQQADRSEDRDDLYGPDISRTEPGGKKDKSGREFGTESAFGADDRDFTGLDEDDDDNYARGGRVGLYGGGEAMAPAGFVEGPPSRFTDRQKVADDKNMQVEEGTFVINAAAVEEAGSEDIKKMILDAYSVAQEQGNFSVDRPLYEKAVDVAVSRGEVIVPPQLARIIGYDRLRKINNRGKKETQERIEENGQQPTGAAEGGFLSRLFGFGSQASQPDVSGTGEGFAEKPQEAPVEPASASTPLPAPSQYEEIVRSALQVAEDNRMKGYVPTNNSGVTIGRGFDIGQHSITDLEKMGLNTSMLSKLTPYVGSFKDGKFVAKTGAKARAALAKDPLTITDQKALEDLNLTVQRKKHEEFEDFLQRYKVPVPTSDVDKAVMFTEYYVGNFKTGKGPKEGSFFSKKNNRHVTIRDSFLKAFKEGNGYDALYDGIIVPLRGKSSQAAKEARNRADRMIKWWSENKDFASITEPMVMPKLPKPDKPVDVSLPTPKPKRDSSATRGGPRP